MFKIDNVLQEKVSDDNARAGSGSHSSYWTKNARRQEYTNLKQHINEKMDKENAQEAAKKIEESERKKHTSEHVSMPRSHGLIIKII